MRPPVGDQATYPNVKLLSAVRSLWGNSPCEPINQISRDPIPARCFVYTIFEPSGEILNSSGASPTSAIFCGSPACIVTDHRLAAPPGGTTDARNLVESGYQLPKTQ